MGRKKKNPNQTNQTESTNQSNQDTFGNEEISSDEKLKDLSENYQAEKEEQIKKPRGIAGKKLKEAEAEKEAAQMFTGIGSMLMAMIVDRLPKNSPLSDTEKNQIDTAFARVAVKYVSVFGEYQDEFTLLSVVTVIVLSRINLFSKKEIKKENDPTN